MATTQKGLAARLAASAGAIVLASMIALGGALPASAVDLDPNAPNAPRGSITIHKHEQTGADGPPGTGSPLDPVAGVPIGGVVFKIEPVQNLPLTDNATWDLLTNDPTDPLDSPALTAEDVGAETLYPLGTALPLVTTGTSGPNLGIATASNLPIGVYLVSEVSAPPAAGVVIMSQPFLVVIPQPTNNTWNYDVHVYPKNTVSDIVKTAEPFAPEVLPAAITWTLDIGVPVPVEGHQLDSFTVVDSLDSRLTHAIDIADAVRVWVDATALVRGPDAGFTVALDAEANQVTITFEEDGIAALLANPDKRVKIEIDTTATSQGDGTIVNSATPYVNGVGTQPSSDKVYFGSIEARKHDGNGAALAGATFELRATQTGPALATTTSTSTGLVQFTGVRTNAPTATGATYWVVETAAPAGYNLGEVTQWQVTVPVGATEVFEILAPIVNPQVPPYQLPVTGGSGEAAFMIGGFGLVALALGFAISRRRKTAAEV